MASTQFDFKKEWEKTKKQLMKFSQEAANIAKKGEQEILEFSRKGKLFIDSKAISLKKDTLYKQIGEAYVRLKDPLKPTAKLKRLVDEVKKIDKEERSLKKQLKSRKR